MTGHNIYVKLLCAYFQASMQRDRNIILPLIQSIDPDYF